MNVTSMGGDGVASWLEGSGYVPHKNNDYQTQPFLSLDIQQQPQQHQRAQRPDWVINRFRYKQR